MAMARLCRIRTKVCLAPSFGRCLQKELWTRPWIKEDARPPCSLGTWECLQSQSQRVNGVHNLLGRQREPSVRLCHSAPAAVVRQKAVDKKTEEFKLVYRFPGIKYCRVLSRLKLLQTATTVVMLPPICYLYLQDQLLLHLKLANKLTRTSREVWSVLFPVSSSRVLKPLSLGRATDADSFLQPFPFPGCQQS